MIQFKITFEVLFLKKESENFRNQVIKYFEKQGYGVEKAQGSAGVPDLYVYNEKEEFFVEIKGNRKDGLRDTQINWMVMFPNKKVIVVFQDREPLIKNRSRLPLTTWYKMKRQEI